MYIPFLKFETLNLGLFEFKIIVKKIRIIEMRPPHKFDGMVPALPHSADLGDTHGNKNIRFNTFGIFSNTPCVEHAFILGVIFGQHLQPLIGFHVVRHEINRYPAGINIGNLVPARNDADR